VSNAASTLQTQHQKTPIFGVSNSNGNVYISQNVTHVLITICKYANCKLTSDFYHKSWHYSTQHRSANQK